MHSDATKQYRDFWETLLPAYPVSKGTLRLPIATDLITIADFDHAACLAELTTILEALLAEHGTQEAAITRAQAAGDERLIPLLTAEYTGVVRFDCLWNPETKAVRILEINCDYPDGLLLHDKTYSALAAKPTTRHEDLLLKLFTADEPVSVLHAPGAYFRDGYHAEAASLERNGHTGTVLTDTAHLPDSTTVRRCLETTKLTPQDIAALAAAGSRLVNTVSLRTLGYKDLLSTIQHPYIPTTTKVTAATSAACTAAKDTLVLKPADGCEGYGIYFGRDVSTLEWQELLMTAQQKNYVAQELVPIPKRPVSLYEHDTIVEKMLYYDICPHFFIHHGTIIGAGHTLMRFSENPIVNVSQGGGIGYYH